MSVKPGVPFAGSYFWQTDRCRNLHESPTRPNGGKRIFLFLSKHLRQTANKTFSFAEVKGWSNYLCLERLHQIRSAQSQGQLDGLAEQASANEIQQISEWASTTQTGDKADLDFAPQNASWRAVSVSSEEALRSDCPHVASCFPLQARQTAATADVIVANHALYAIDLQIGGALLGGHELVIFDEAHQIEDSFSEAFGFELTAARFRWLADLRSPTSWTRHASRSSR